LYNKINRVKVPEIDLRERVMARINIEKGPVCTGKRYLKLVFAVSIFVVFFFQGLIFLNESILDFVENADKANLLYQIIKTVKLDRLAALIKDFDIGSILRAIVYFFRDIFSASFNFLI
jgi:hypothetical protein